MNFLEITRDKRFSPNMQKKDRDIIDDVAKILVGKGHQVKCIDENEFVTSHEADSLQQCDAIFTMLRSEEALMALEFQQSRNVIAMNPAKGIKNAERKLITKLMADNGIHLPPTSFNLDYSDLKDCKFPCWIKRGEGWAQDKNDVIFVENENEAMDALKTLKEKYTQGTVMAVKHIKGDLLKFYGVEGTDFFFVYYPDVNNTKFGMETINGKQQKFSFNAEKLKNECNKIAHISKIYVYGGDCIVTPDGDFYIIDFNDWPSFSPCRQQAAKAIANRLLTEINK